MLIVDFLQLSLLGVTQTSVTVDLCFINSAPPNIELVLVLLTHRHRPSLPSFISYFPGVLGGRLWWCLAVFFNDTRWCRYSYYFPSCGVCLPRCLVASSLGIWWCLLLNSVLSSDTRWYLSIFPSTSTPRAVCVSDEAMKRQESISTPPRDLRTRKTSST